MIYGLVGYARVGKDTIAQFLTTKIHNGKRIFSHQAYRYAFADELKEEVEQCLKEFSGKTVDLRQDEAKVRFRPLLVAWGEARRALDPECWIDALFKKLSVSKNYIITDCRYLNECIAIKRAGGKIIYVDRPNFLPANDVEKNSIAEIRMADIIDDTIENSGSLEDLENEAKRIIRFI